MAYQQERGWFSEVNGVAVRKRPLPSGFYSGWQRGNPIGAMFHYTAGCGDPYYVLRSRGISAHFVVHRDGTIDQLVSLLDSAAHAYDANHYYYGVEHVALKQRCDLTDRQLAASAKLFAALAEFIGKRWGVKVPLRHVEGCAFEPGFKQHRDGIGCDWNPNTHVDGLYHWSWNRYLAAIEENMPPVYVFQKQRYSSADNLLRRLRRILKRSKPGESHTIRVTT